MAVNGEAETVDHQLSLDLYAVILRVHEGATEDLVHAIADSKLSLSKLKLLHILARPHRRPPRIKRAGELLGIDASQTARAVQELDEERLVDRIPDEIDGRVKRVVITPAGRQLLERLDRARLRQLEKFVRTLEADERRLLRSALDVLLERPDIVALRPAG